MAPRTTKNSNYDDEKMVIVKEIHKPSRKHFPRRKVVVKGIFETLEIDLVDMVKFAKDNSNYKYILTVICTFSKKGFARPLKSKSQNDVASAMESVLEEIGDRVKHIHSDNGKEFKNKTFQKLLAKYKINHFITQSGLKCTIVERWNRTIKTKMWLLFSYNSSYKWIHILQKIVDEYNNSYHRTIKMTPNEVNQENAKVLLRTVYNYPKIFRKNKFRVGDKVRISRYKNTFDKGYSNQWSYEVFEIKSVQNTSPITYILKDHEENEILGGFYEYELQKAKLPDVFLVEKVLKRSKGQALVKWMGYPNPTYIPEKDIL